MSITIKEIVEAVAATLGTNMPSLVQAQTRREVTEAIPHTPMAQIYCEEFELGAGSQTDRTSFRGQKRQKRYVIHVDLAVHPRSELGEALARGDDILDELITVLEMQDTKPYFGLAELDAYKPLTIKRVVIEYGQTLYTGWRAPLEFRVI